MVDDLTLCACASDQNMADYHEERTLTEGFRRCEKKDKNDCSHTTIQEPQENPEKRFMLEKGREALRNDSGLKHKTSIVRYIVCTKLLRGCVFIY